MLDHCARGMRRGAPGPAARGEPAALARRRPHGGPSTTRRLSAPRSTRAPVVRGALEAVSRARRRGIRVWAETRPIYSPDEERYAAGGPRRRSSSGRRRSGPVSIRPRSGTAAVGRIQAIGSDIRRGRSSRSPRAPRLHARALRRPASRRTCASSTPRGWPRGASRSDVRRGVFDQSRAPSALSRRADRGRQRRRFVLFDPARESVVDERQLHSRAGYDPFHGFHLAGGPVMTSVARRDRRARRAAREPGGPRAAPRTPPAPRSRLKRTVMADARQRTVVDNRDHGT